MKQLNATIAKKLGLVKDKSIFKVGDVIMNINRVRDYSFKVDAGWLKRSPGIGEYYRIATEDEVIDHNISILIEKLESVIDNKITKLEKIKALKEVSNSIYGQIIIMEQK